MLLVAGNLKKRVVNHLHGADFSHFYQRSGILKILLKKAYQTIDTSIVLTKTMEKEFNHFPLMQKKVVANFYPMDFDKAELKKKKGIVVTYFSNLLKSKGIFEFLEAVKLVHQKRPDIRFKVAGKCMGDHLMSAHQMNQKVKYFLVNNQNLPLQYIGEIEPSARFTFLAQSHIFVLPTYYPTEGFPLSIIEAMRCGNVIIATKHNYLSDVVKSENGMLVNPNSPKEIKEAIFKYIDDKLLMKKTQDYNMQEAIERYSEVCHLKEVKRVIGV